MGELDPLDFLPPKKQKQQNSRLLDDTSKMDWCVRAKKIALKSIEARDWTNTIQDLITVNKKTKKKNKKKLTNKNKIDKRDKTLEEDSDFDSGEEDFELQNMNPLDGTTPLRRTVSMIGGGMFQERKEKTREAFVQRLLQFSGPSDSRKEIKLNKAIVETQTTEEVLEVTVKTIMAVGKGLSTSPPSLLNIATALNRIAKNMEKVSMMRTRRLAFARQREMSMLVAIAMMALPECSAQGISNISWAFSKIGGELLYLSEMDRVAEVALTKVSEFNSQNVANLAGSFASMWHSAPDLFSELSKRASDIIHTFQKQELAQVLWAFASLYEPADPMLESLDNAFKGVNQFNCFLGEKTPLYNEERGVESIAILVLDRFLGSPSLNFSRDQLENIAWSYAVLGQIDRLYLRSDQEERIVRAGKTKRFNKKMTSSFQKDVARLLVSTGLDWVRENALDGYTLDAVLVDKKIALEIDGPTHFSRNSGAPLGHTMLKCRYISTAGWKLIHVSHEEWEELQGGFEQQDYLRKVLEGYLDESGTKTV
ncbi:hypothetical protein F0562_034685 [Nyssa sinensis]|uniref:RAP domain-containing protein n=1 Tax=Nyssa sinensis TaxID=561372 RepID=A0A5J5AAZ6_9ASTE|nr:hypothetical protein F0562_034685 [Nyssa sinensis]